MTTLERFIAQENRDYRNMQIVFTLLAINFLIPGLSYMFTPALALQNFRTLGSLLGGPAYPLSEESYLWRVLASGNVVTLGFICVLLQLNIRRFYAAVPVFAVLKAWSALGYLYVFLTELSYRLFLVVFFWDGLAVFLIVYFGTRAYRSLSGASPAREAGLVPRLRLS